MKNNYQLDYHINHKVITSLIIKIIENLKNP